MSASTKPNEPGSRATLTVTVHDDDDGSTYRIGARPDDDVNDVITILYRDHLGRDRRPGDRLRCDGSGSDVTAHAAKKLRAYQATECRDLTWSFAGDQGGA